MSPQVAPLATWQLIQADVASRAYGRTEIIDLWVPVPLELGHARTKGSVNLVNSGRKGGRPYLDATPEAKAWQAEVAGAVRGHLASRPGWAGRIMRPELVTGVLVISVPHDDVTNRLVGDGDKHLRLVWDALTKAQAWEDDAQGQGWTEWKVTASDRHGPGVHIMAWRF